MKTVRVAVLFGFGINCDHETAAVFRLVGAEADRLHVNRLIESPDLLSSYDILAIPGGFSFGDHLGSGRLLGNRLRSPQSREEGREGRSGVGCRAIGRFQDGRRRKSRLEWREYRRRTASPGIR